ncbi:SDR family oxidoreductase [Caballeronia sordidicola]|uniref:Putative oxidoreductase/Short-chain dehydrogenase n=1 Tax=Caballeronia sordidicola TaxID=196367 RepID=A0A242MK67_CABSO|nr:SDR family oxidoreductase [Caballeronia sordidicola]OTP71699.1 putative oxidoreductase/Short-chain dehydrogenase [Caballeronia sordidicola]
MSTWTTADIPPQTGKRVVVTGATGGLGYETSLELARAGAEVILTGRNEAKGRAAIDRIRHEVPNARVSFEMIDLASLKSIARASEHLLADGAPVDILVNNAGVMMLPQHEKTADGFERQFGTNYLGHFALTSQLLPLLQKSAAPRVVNLSSIAHRRGKIAFDNLQGERAYKAWPAYEQSKLAMLMFALELQRRSDANGWGLMSNAAHPGFARTDLIANGPGTSGMLALAGRVMSRFLSHSAAEGALPTLLAATAPEARGAAYYGPKGFQEMIGPPSEARIFPQATDAAVGAKLWDVSAKLTGTEWGPKRDIERDIKRDAKPGVQRPENI